MTTQERKLWNILRNHKFYGYEFRRQYPIGDYIVDFICRDKKVIIEIDGGQHNTDKIQIYDKKRTQFLQNLGYTVVRFWNDEIDDSIDCVYEKLIELFRIP